MRVAAVQHDIVWERPSETFDLVAPMISQAAATGADLVAVTEMFSTGFSMNTAVTAEPLDGPSATFLLEQAAANDIILVGSVPTHHPDHALPVNLLTVATPDGIAGQYAKIHPFSFSGEDQHFSAGRNFLTIELDSVRCTFFVCYDLRFADEFWATAADTDLYIVVANWPAARRLHWDTLLRARAIENQTYVLASNRVGDDGNGLAHSGGSTLIDPFGETLALGSVEPCIVAGTVDPDRVAEVRARYPFAADRR
jgi:predicted amidohydrolase